MEFEYLDPVYESTIGDVETEVNPLYENDLSGSILDADLDSILTEASIEQFEIMEECTTELVIITEGVGAKVVETVKKIWAKIVSTLRNGFNKMLSWLKSVFGKKAVESKEEPAKVGGETKKSESKEAGAATSTKKTDPKEKASTDKKSSSSYTGYKQSPAERLRLTAGGEAKKEEANKGEPKFTEFNFTGLDPDFVSEIVDGFRRQSQDLMIKSRTVKKDGSTEKIQDDANAMDGLISKIKKGLEGGHKVSYLGFVYEKDGDGFKVKEVTKVLGPISGTANETQNVVDKAKKNFEAAAAATNDPIIIKLSNDISKVASLILQLVAKLIKDVAACASRV